MSSNPYEPPPEECGAEMLQMDECVRTVLALPPGTMRLTALLQSYDLLTPALQRQLFGVCAVYLTKLWDPPTE